MVATAPRGDQRACFINRGTSFWPCSNLRCLGTDWQHLEGGLGQPEAMLVHTGFSRRGQWSGAPTACEALRPGRSGHGLLISCTRAAEPRGPGERSHRLRQDPVSAARRDNGSSQSGSPSLSRGDDICLRLPCDAQVLGTEPGHREPSREASCRPCGSEVGQEDAWRWRASPHVMEREVQAVTTTPCRRVTLCVLSPSVTLGLWGRLVKKTTSP